MPISLGIGTAVTRGGGLSWSPLSISGLQFWVDSADSATLYTDSALTTLAVSDGDVIGGWKDKSGNSRNALQADGTKKPMLKLAIQNGRNGILFDGVNDFLASLASFSGPSSSRWAYMVVNVNATRLAVFCHGTSDADEIFGIWFGTNGYYVDIGASMGPYADTIGSITSGYKLIGAVWTRPVNSILALKVNGISTAPTVSGAHLPPNTADQVIEIGRRNTGYWPSYICELVYGNGGISNDDEVNLNNYLNVKWGIY